MVDDLKPRYTTKRLRQEIERARENDARHIAALEAQLAERVKVKPLEWVELNEGKAFRALLPVIGSIRIEPYGVCGWWEVLWSMPGQCDKLIPDVFDTPDEAKAAAQADFDRRILSALESTTPAPKVTEAKVWPDGFFTLHGDARLRDCATEGCSQHVSIRIERGGTGSDHCEPCASRIAAITAAQEADQ